VSSYKKQLRCYVADYIFYIDNPEGLVKIRLEGLQDQLEKQLESQRNLNSNLERSQNMICVICVIGIIFLIRYLSFMSTPEVSTNIR
jgi:hypothetical protein